MIRSLVVGEALGPRSALFGTLVLSLSTPAVLVSPPCTARLLEALRNDVLKTSAMTPAPLLGYPSI